MKTDITFLNKIFADVSILSGLLSKLFSKVQMVVKNKNKKCTTFLIKTSGIFAFCQQNFILTFHTLEIDFCHFYSPSAAVSGYFEHLDVSPRFKKNHNSNNECWKTNLITLS